MILKGLVSLTFQHVFLIAKQTEGQWWLEWFWLQIVEGFEPWVPIDGPLGMALGSMPIQNHSDSFQAKEE